MVKNSKIINLLNISKSRTNLKKRAADLDSAPPIYLINSFSLLRSKTVYTCDIDLFLTKDVSYNSTCYTINDLSSNHLPVILKFDRVNITKNELTLNKTDWPEFSNKTDGWRIDYRLQDAEFINHCINNYKNSY